MYLLVNYQVKSGNCDEITRRANELQTVRAIFGTSRSKTADAQCGSTVVT